MSAGMLINEIDVMNDVDGKLYVMDRETGFRGYNGKKKIVTTIFSTIDGRPLDLHLTRSSRTTYYGYVIPADNVWVYEYTRAQCEQLPFSIDIKIGLIPVDCFKKENEYSGMLIVPVKYSYSNIDGLEYDFYKCDMWKDSHTPPPELQWFIRSLTMINDDRPVNKLNHLFCKILGDSNRINVTFYGDSVSITNTGNIAIFIGDTEDSIVEVSYQRAIRLYKDLGRVLNLMRSERYEEG